MGLLGEKETLQGKFARVLVAVEVVVNFKLSSEQEHTCPSILTTLSLICMRYFMKLST